MKISIAVLLIISTLVIPWHAYCQEMELLLDPEPKNIDSLAIIPDEIPLLPDTHELRNDSLAIDSYRNIYELAREDADDEGNAWIYVVLGIIAAIPAFVHIFSDFYSPELPSRIFKTGPIFMVAQLPIVVILGNLASFAIEKPDRDITGYSEKQQNIYNKAFRMKLMTIRTLDILQGYAVSTLVYGIVILAFIIGFIVWLILFALFVINAP